MKTITYSNPIWPNENSWAGVGLLEHACRAALEGLLGEQRQPGAAVVVAMAAGPRWPHFLRVVTSVVGPCPGWLSGAGGRGCPSWVLEELSGGQPWARQPGPQVLPCPSPHTHTQNRACSRN